MEILCKKGQSRGVADKDKRVQEKRERGYLPLLMPLLLWFVLSPALLRSAGWRIAGVA